MDFLPPFQEINWLIKRFLIRPMKSFFRFQKYRLSDRNFFRSFVRSLGLFICSESSMNGVSVCLSLNFFSDVVFLFSNKIQMCKQSALYVTLTTAAAASVALDKQMQQEKCFMGWFSTNFLLFAFHFHLSCFHSKHFGLEPQRLRTRLTRRFCSSGGGGPGGV